MAERTKIRNITTYCRTSETDVTLRLFRIESLRQLPSGSFSIVMATGIVAVAVHEVALGSLTKILFAFATLSYVALWVLFALRSWRLTQQMRGGALHYDRAPTGMQC